MSPAIWIAIATTIATLATSWSQFWLKERAEKKRALATAKPETNQPKAVKGRDNTARLGVFFAEKFKRYWLLYSAQFFVNATTILIGLTMYRETLPINSNTVAMFVFSSIGTILLAVAVWRAKT
jgi:hypothetical protein